MKLEGRLRYEGRKEDEEIFVFYGHNPTNGEPWKPIEIRVKAGSDDVAVLHGETKKDNTLLLMSVKP